LNGVAFNIGGGPANTLCLRDLITFLGDELSLTVTTNSGISRPGDQPVFICDIRKAKSELEWEPQVSVKEGVKDLISWVKDNRELFNWLKE
jgi:CDP-paratose 2-epimerase